MYDYLCGALDLTALDITTPPAKA